MTTCIVEAFIHNYDVFIESVPSCLLFMHHGCLLSRLYLVTTNTLYIIATVYLQNIHNMDFFSIAITFNGLY